MNRDEYYAALNDNKRLVHALGDERKNHTYYQRIVTGIKNGHKQFKYFYSAKEYQTYLNNAKKTANKVDEKVRNFTTAAGKTIKKAATDATRKTAKKVMNAASKKYNENRTFVRNTPNEITKDKNRLANSQYRKDIKKNYEDSKENFEKNAKINSNMRDVTVVNARTGEVSHPKRDMEAGLDRAKQNYIKDRDKYNSINNRLKSYDDAINKNSSKTKEQVRNALSENRKLLKVMDLSRQIYLNPEKAGELIGAAAKDAASKTASKALKTAAKQAEKAMKKLQSQGAKGKKKLASIIKDSVQKMYDSTDINKDAEYLRALDSEKNSKEVLSNYQESYNVKDNTSQVTNKKTGKKANDLETAMYDDAVVTNFRSKQTQANKKSRYNSKGNQTKRRILKTVKNVTDKW